MRKMKYSGIEWIGEIPEEWNLERLRFHALFNPETTLPEFSDEDQVSFIPMDHLKSGFHTQTSTAFDKVKKGYVTFSEHDILMAKVTPCLENGNLAIATDLIDGIGFGSTEINVIRCKTINNKYLFYLLRCQGYIEKATYNMFGVAGLKRLTPEFIPNSLFPIPSPEEQQAIVEYLDTKCAEIDALITAKEKTNALLKERRQSMIYEAVTKGLDPTSPMKDSGVEWIGEIPVGWSVSRIKRVAEIVTGNTPSKASGDLNYSDDGLMWVKPDNLLGITPIKDTSEHLSDNGCMLAKVVPEKTPLTCCIGTIGKVGYSEEAVAFNQQINAICFNESVDSRFGLYCLISQEEQQKCFANGNVLKILNAEVQGRLFITIPSLPEQIIISKYLDTQCQIIDEIVKENDATIQKLKEYRQSLIYEAVTGKIEV